MMMSPQLLEKNKKQKKKQKKTKKQNKTKTRQNKKTKQNKQETLYRTMFTLITNYQIQTTNKQTKKKTKKQGTFLQFFT